MAAAVLHRLLVLHPDGKRILLARGESGWQLPSALLPERHTAEVEQINTAALQRWRLVTTVLCGLEYARTADGICRTLALEAHAPLPPLSDDELQWGEPERLGAGAPPESDGDADRPWTRPGWWPAVRLWIAAHAGPVDVVQTRAWESSCVARVQPSSTTSASHWFKALPLSAPREARVTGWLSGKPGATMVVAIDLERQWLLLRAFAGTSLDDSRDPNHWALAAATWGRLQATSFGRVAELRQLGCAERRLDDLAAAIQPLADDGTALLPGHPEGMSATQIESLRRLAPRLRRRCDELAALGLPAALDHGDLWPSNVLVGGGACVIIDWEDAGIGQPFLSLAPLIVMLREWQVRLPLDDLADAYLVPLCGAERAHQLHRAFLRALPLGLVEMAVRYWRVPAEIAGLHPWMREMVPFFLRHAIALEE